MRIVLGVTLAAVSLAVSACCCRPPLADRVKALERENDRLKFEVDATEKANAASRDYATELESGGAATPMFAMYYSQTDLDTFARKKTLPYRMDASKFNRQLKGQIVVDRIHSFQFLPGNKLRCKMEFHGVNIQYTGNVPNAYKAELKRFVDGVEAGVIADVDVSLALKGRKIEALAVATATKLKKNSKPMFENELRDQMNRRAFKDPLEFDMKVEKTTARLTRVLVTGNHIVVTYAP